MKPVQTEHAKPAGRHPNPSVTIRRARAVDREALASFYAGLGRPTLRQRFHCAFKGLSPARIAQLTALEAIDAQQVHTLVAIDGLLDSSSVVAHAGLHVDGPHSAEFALVVADLHQGQGIGLQLMTALLDAASERGLRYLHAGVLRDNRAMVSLMNRMDVEADDDPDDRGLIRVRIAVPPQPVWRRILRWAVAARPSRRTSEVGVLA